MNELLYLRMKKDVPKDQDTFYEEKELSEDIKKRREY